MDRAKVLPFFVMLKPGLIGLKACGSAYFWARKLVEMRKPVKRMAPQFVKAYVNVN